MHSQGSIQHLTSPSDQIAQKQREQDGDVQGLVESLGEMAGAASVWEEPREIPGTINVMDEIGKASLEAAMLVHDYVDPSFRGKANFLGTFYLLEFSSSYVANNAFRMNQLAPLHTQCPTCLPESQRSRSDVKSSRRSLIAG